MTFADELQPFHLETDTDPDNAFTENTEAMDDDLYPDELDESSNALADDNYPDDDDYEEIGEDEQ